MHSNPFYLLHYFRINDPYRLLGLLGLLLVICAPLFFDHPGLTFPELKNLIIGEKVHEGNSLYTELVDPVGPFAGWFNGVLNLLFGRSLLARHILAFILIFLQACYIGIVFANKKAFAENSYIPSLIAGILFTFSFDTLSLTPELLGAGFLIPALNNLFKEIEFREQRDESIFNLGLYISLASLFSFSYSVYIIGALIILIIFTRSSPRKLFLLFLGFLLPHGLLLSSYYLMDGLTYIWHYYYLPNLNWNAVQYVPNHSLWMLAILPLSFLAISFIAMNRDARLSKYQTQLVQSMFFWLLFSVIQVLYSKDLRPQNFISLIPGLSFFITHFLLLINRKKFAEMYIWILLLGSVSISYASRYNLIEKISYDNLLVPDLKPEQTGKRILVLDDNWSTYRYNQLASPFLEWRLTKTIFSNPQYYKNVIQVDEGIMGDPPEVIRDPDDLLGPFLQRIPELKKTYHRSGIYYIKTLSN